MIPLIIAGAVLGIGAHACAASDNEEAKEKNERANRIITDSRQKAERAKENCQNSMNTLAMEKAIILKGNMNRFVKSFSKIKAVNFSETQDLFETAKFNKNELMVMQNMVSEVQKVSVNEVAGGVSGAALAVGAADVLTGGAIVGEGLAIGGLAGGAALGAIAAPVFAVTGIFAASEAAANLEKAESNLAKARAYEDQCDTYAYFADGVSDRCQLFYNTLHQIDNQWFGTAVDQLENLVNSKKTFGNFFRNMAGKKIYTREEMQRVASVASLAKMLKTIIDTNILDKNGNLTEESEQVIDDMREQLDAGMPEVAHQLRPVQYSSAQAEQAARQIAAGQLTAGKNSKNRGAYHPAVFTQIIMWLLCVGLIACGGMMLLISEFAPAALWAAAGLIMCPKVNRNMRFWPRFITAIIFVFIGIVVVGVTGDAKIAESEPVSVSQPESEVAPEPVAAEEPEPVPAFAAEDYAGNWAVDRYSDYLDGYVAFYLDGTGDTLNFSASAADDENLIVTINETTLELNHDNTEAGAAYMDSLGNSGKIILDFEDDDLYLTITREQVADYWGLEMEREHCSRDLNGEVTQRIQEYMTTAQEKEAQAQTEAIANTLHDYIYGLNDAINLGEFEFAAKTLLNGSAAYTEQKALVEKLHEQGITENVIEFAIKSQQVDGNTATVITDELIGVHFQDGSSKEVSQSYAYHMQLQSDGTWLIDSMVEQ